MTRKRFREERIIAVPEENGAGAKVDDLCQHHGISTATFYSEPLSRRRSERRSEL